MNRDFQKRQIINFLKGRLKKDIDAFMIYQWIDRCYAEGWWSLALSLSSFLPPNSLAEEYHKRLDFLLTECRKVSEKHKIVAHNNFDEDVIIKDHYERKEIIPYIEMCRREGVLAIQRGMHFQLGGNHSVLLMSVSPDAPYADRIGDDDSTIIYQGHDIQKSSEHPDPKSFDQPEFTSMGQLTENGRFHKAAQDFKAGNQPPEHARVYEKLKPGVWSYNGMFHLVDSWQDGSGGRNVFKFKLIRVEDEEAFSTSISDQFMGTRNVYQFENDRSFHNARQNRTAHSITINSVKYKSVRNAAKVLSNDSPEIYGSNGRIYTYKSRKWLLKNGYGHF